jgi:hypothetical protein
MIISVSVPVPLKAEDTVFHEKVLSDLSEHFHSEIGAEPVYKRDQKKS